MMGGAVEQVYGLGARGCRIDRVSFFLEVSAQRIAHHWLIIYDQDADISSFAFVHLISARQKPDREGGLRLTGPNVPSLTVGLLTRTVVAVMHNQSEIGSQARIASELSSTRPPCASMILIASAACTSNF